MLGRSRYPSLTRYSKWSSWNPMLVYRYFRLSMTTSMTTRHLSTNLAGAKVTYVMTTHLSWFLLPMWKELPA